MAACSQERATAPVPRLRRRRRAHLSGPLRRPATATRIPRADGARRRSSARSRASRRRARRRRCRPTTGRPILAALDAAPHVGLLDARRADHRRVLGRGRARPRSPAGVHDPGIIDPRSAGFHGDAPRSVALVADARSRRSERVRPLPRRHPVAPRRRHRSRAGRPGVHELPRPARRRARVLDVPRLGRRGVPAARSLLLSGRRRAALTRRTSSLRRSARRGLPCSTCHPVPGSPVIGGLHGDGIVEVTFDPTLVPGQPSYDTATGACAVSCHAMGGTKPNVTWTRGRIPRRLQRLPRLAAGGPLHGPLHRLPCGGQRDRHRAHRRARFT